MSAEKKKTYRLAVAAMLSAIAAVLQFVEISIPIMPTFVKLDVSDLPALLGTFALGPVWGVAIELVKNLLHLPFGHSAGVGELCNFLLGGVFAFVAGLVYHRGKTRRTAAWGAVLGAVAMAAASLPLNYFLVYPAYVVLYRMPLDAIVGAYEAILGTVAHIPTGNALLNCLVVFNVPFTLVKGLIDVVLCFLIYKPLSPLLHK
jgi:riboflavin transporter FmnP